jgi:hypothetical protein
MTSNQGLPLIGGFFRVQHKGAPSLKALKLEEVTVKEGDVNGVQIALKCKNDRSHCKLIEANDQRRERLLTVLFGDRFES